MKDAIIYAAIISDLANRPVDDNKCFLSNDVRAFSYHTIRQELRRFNCRYISRFSALDAREARGRDCQDGLWIPIFGTPEHASGQRKRLSAATGPLSVLVWGAGEPTQTAEMRKSPQIGPPGS